jgi:hypothetical protein
MRLAFRPARAAGVAAAFVLLGAPFASAQSEIPLTVSGREATGTIALPGGIGADLTITFEEVVGLNPASLAVSARLTGPLDSALLSRLGGGGLVVPPAAFPVVVTIEPSASSALTFSGAVAVSLHTHNLHLLPSVPLALHSASGGGAFRDITKWEGIGSYRAGGTGGGFSEFVIVVDQRPIGAVVAAKFDALAALLEAHAAAIPGAVLADLEARLDQARTLDAGGSTVAAIAAVGGFADVVRANSGAGIPDVWRAHDARTNVAGLLRSAADSLKFSLTRKSGGGSS